MEKFYAVNLTLNIVGIVLLCVSIALYFANKRIQSIKIAKFNVWFTVFILGFNVLNFVYLLAINP